MAIGMRRTLLEAGMCCDLATCGVSLILASSWLSLPLLNTGTLQLHHPLRQTVAAVTLILCWHLSLIATGAYRSYRTIGLRAQVEALLRGASLTSVFAAIFLLLSRWHTRVALTSISADILTFWLLTAIGLIGSRLAARVWTRSLRRRGRNLRTILIVGSNRRSIALADRLLADPSLGFQIAGFVDDTWYFDAAPDHYKAMLLGDSANLLDLLRTYSIDEVIITLPIASSYAFTEQIIEWCAQQGIPVHSEGNLFDVTAPRAFIPARNYEIITHHEVRHSELSTLTKRAFDLLLSGCALVLLSPVLAITALAIKFSSPGPVLFAQERLGRNKRTFRIYKFRTMVTNAEALMAKVEHLNQSEGPTFKLKHDPRIIPIGHFLRKTSLDELPQLFNVFLGSMSLVGPRPLPLRDYRGFSADWHRRRFSVKPGVTCLWQISGRSSIGFEQWMELDMDYIDRWSLLLDAEILLKTIPAVLRGSGAM